MTSAISPVRSIGESHLTAAPRALTKRRARGAQLRGWFFVIPALVAYAAFVLWPILQTFRYSFYNWDGVNPAQWVGVQNYKTVFNNEQLVGVIGHAFELILFFSGVPVVLGLAVATVMRRFVTGRVGAVARTVLFLPQVVPLVAAGIAWSWMLSTTGVVDQVLSNIGLANWAQAWLGGFNTALPAVGVIGAWVLLGLCTVLLYAGMTKIDPALYESAQLDGAGPTARVPGNYFARAASRGCRLCNRDCDRCAFSVRYCLYLDPGRPR